MESIELQRIERRARLKYEWSRARSALIGFAPAMLVVLVAALFTRRLSSTVAFGVLMFLTGATLLWYGRDLRRAVLPGLVAGIVPLASVVCANGIGHACTGDSCIMVCIPICVAGGFVAGLAVAAVGHRGGHGVGFWLGASTVALLTGAMGCICVGYAGLAGLGVGFGAGMVPTAVQALFARNPR